MIKSSLYIFIIIFCRFLESHLLLMMANQTALTLKKSQIRCCCILNTRSLGALWSAKYGISSLDVNANTSCSRVSYKLLEYKILCATVWFDIDDSCCMSASLSAWSKKSSLLNWVDYLKHSNFVNSYRRKTESLKNTLFYSFKIQPIINFYCRFLCGCETDVWNFALSSKKVTFLNFLSKDVWNQLFSNYNDLHALII